MNDARTSLNVAAALLWIAAGCTSPTPPPMNQRHHTIDYVELTVLDMAAAQRFYGAAFGWTFQDYGPDYCGLREPDGREFGGLRVDEAVATGGPLVVLYSRDLDASVAAVRAAGGRIRQQPFAFPGGRRFHFSDPAGNELAVWSDDAASNDE